MTPAEDADGPAGLGAAQAHLGFRDALFRRGRRGPAYPTYRFDAARGRVASCDIGLAGEVSARVSQTARPGEAGMILAPLGVDHLITRRAGEAGPCITATPLFADGLAGGGLRPASGPGPASLAPRARREREPDRRIPDSVRRIVL
jgi:hypothetical protein